MNNCQAYQKYNYYDMNNNMNNNMNNYLNNYNNTNQLYDAYTGLSVVICF